MGDMSRFRILWGGPYNKLAPTSESVARVQEEREKERRREREGKGLKETLGALDLVGMHTSAYVSIRQHTSTYVSIGSGCCCRVHVVVKLAQRFSYYIADELHLRPSGMPLAAVPL